MRSAMSAASFVVRACSNPWPERDAPDVEPERDASHVEPEREAPRVGVVVVHAGGDSGGLIENNPVPLPGSGPRKLPPPTTRRRHI